MRYRLVAVLASAVAVGTLPSHALGASPEADVTIYGGTDICPPGQEEGCPSVSELGGSFWTTLGAGVAAAVAAAWANAEAVGRGAKKAASAVWDATKTVGRWFKDTGTWIYKNILCLGQCDGPSARAVTR